MVEPMSWLYGATQSQECPSCGVPVYTTEYATMENHIRWQCQGPAKSKALVVFELDPGLSEL